MELLIFVVIIVVIIVVIYFGLAAAAGCDVIWFLRKPVYLLHFDGKVTKSRIHNLGKTKVAYAYPFAQVGDVTLLDAGRTSGRSYIVVAWSDTGEFSEEQRDRILLKL